MRVICRGGAWPLKAHCPQRSEVCQENVQGFHLEKSVMMELKACSLCPSEIWIKFSLSLSLSLLFKFSLGKWKVFHIIQRNRSLKIMMNKENCWECWTKKIWKCLMSSLWKAGSFPSHESKITEDHCKFSVFPSESFALLDSAHLFWPEN